MHSSKVGSLGEMKAACYFLENGYEVFFQFDGKAPFDFILFKDNAFKTVSVKTTSTKTYGNWTVQLKSIRSNKTKNRIENFDNSIIDFLVIYIKPIDKLIVYDAKTIKQKTAMQIVIGELAESGIATDLKSVVND